MNKTMTIKNETKERTKDRQFVESLIEKLVIEKRIDNHTALWMFKACAHSDYLMGVVEKLRGETI